MILKCRKCNRFLCETNDIFNGKIDIICPRCKSKSIFCFQHLDNVIQDVIPPDSTADYIYNNPTTTGFKVLIRS